MKAHEELKKNLDTLAGYEIDELMRRVEILEEKVKELLEIKNKS